MFERRWVPDPLFRRVSQGFFNGPRSAVRGSFPCPRRMRGNNYHLVLSPQRQSHALRRGAPPTERPPAGCRGGSAYFSLANRLDAVNSFWARNGCGSGSMSSSARCWSIARAGGSDAAASIPSARRISPRSWPAPVPRSRCCATRPYSIFSIGPKPCRKASPGGCLLQAGRRIDCDLILDVGNSRTCGLVVEREGSRADLGRAAKLELRDLSSPLQVYSDPFESRVEFARVTFGKNHLSHRSGRSDAFEWPTLARVGTKRQGSPASGSAMRAIRGCRAPSAISGRRSRRNSPGG